MLKIGVVGDLSLQDPQRLWKCLSAACSACDIVVQLGDCHPGYDQMKQAEAVMSAEAAWPGVRRASAALGPRFLAVPGNHDIFWDGKLGWPRTWYRAYEYPDKSGPAVYLVGLDNSADKFEPSTWSVLQSIPQDGVPLIIFVHKPLSTIVLADGSESTHIIGEGAPNADARQLIEWAARANDDRDVLLVHGHYHGWTMFFPGYAPCLIDGRGGAAGTGPGELGWTQIIVTKEGLALHRVDL